jgi:hypothetical protein
MRGVRATIGFLSEIYDYKNQSVKQNRRDLIWEIRLFIVGSARTELLRNVGTVFGMLR